MPRRTSRPRLLGALLLSLALGAGGGVGCGGKDKGQPTTPTGTGQGTDGSQSMTDPGDPSFDGTGGTGTGADGTPGTGPDGEGTGTAEPGAPAEILPPNLDPDPQQARAQVEQHLGVARKALEQTPPDADTALREARLALQTDAANVDAAAMVAFAYYHKKLLDTAELVLDDLFKREAAKRNANVYYVYGLVYDATDRAERARLAYQKAVELNPSHTSALVNLGVHQLKNSQYGEAQETFERLTRQFNRTDAVTLTSLGSAYRGRSADYRPGDGTRDQFVRAAEAAYKRAIETNASYGPAYYNLGLLYLDTDPYPGVADPLQRLTTAKGYFDQYKNQPGVDMKLYDGRMKDVDRAIKRAQRQLKQKQRS